MSLPTRLLSRSMIQTVAGRRRHFHRSAAWAAKRVVQRFKLADIGEGITECEVIKWNVKPASAVQAFDPLCEVQSDKASVEITSPFDGTVKEILVKEGEVAKVGEDLCTIEVDGEVAAELSEEHDAVASSSSPSSAQSSSPSTASISTENESSKKLEHETTTTMPSKKRKAHPLDPHPRRTSSESDVKLAKSSDDHEDALALPSVRHFAKSNGVDIALLAPGSGRNGRVERVDVESFLAQTSQSSQDRSPAISKFTLETTSPQEEVIVELGRTRHNMWKAMVKSLEIPHFGYSTYIDLTKLHNLLPILNAHIPPHYLQSPPDLPPLAVDPSSLYPAPPPPADVPLTGKYTRLTYLPVVLKTLSRAMADWPLFRSSITTTPSSSSSSSTSNGEANNNNTEKPTLTIRPSADISIALSTPTGLYTPTIQNIHTLSIYALASRIAHVAALGRRTPTTGLTPAEMPKRGGTITVSNVGAVGKGEFASPVLVPGGGVAIVAIGRARWVWDAEAETETLGGGRGGRGGRRLRVGVSWSADHRVVEGAELAAFVECWRSWIEHPERLIAEGV